MNRSAILSIFSVVMVLAAGCGYSETDCIPNDHTQCIESVSYWMDSCGVQGQMAEVCDCGCNDDYSGCRQPTDLHAHVSCHDGIEYWVDDCGSEGSIKQTCDCGCNPGSTACQDPCDCTPDCGIRECGPVPNGCGDSCGNCTGGEQCNVNTGQCEACTPDCGSRECGPVPNGCGDSCGSCDANETCEDGTCTPQSSSPVIIDLSSNTSVMNENSTLIITAIVTDPQGIGDLIGGSLKNVSETLSYGAFSTSGEEGSYQITLYWDDLDTVEAVWAERAGRERVFKALFYDQAGHMASDNISVTLQCTAGRAACDGDCLDIRTFATAATPASMSARIPPIAARAIFPVRLSRMEIRFAYQSSAMSIATTVMPIAVRPNAARRSPTTAIAVAVTSSVMPPRTACMEIASTIV